MFGQVALLFLAHMTGDFYSAFYSPLVPYLSEKLGLTLKMIGGLAALHAVTAQFFQPIIGLLSERIGRRRFVVAGVLCAAIGMSALGFAWSFLSVCLFLMVGGLGTGSFHPCGAALAGAGGGNRRSTALSFYTAGGNIGVMLAPLVVPVIVAAGAGNLGFLAVPGVLVAVLLWRLLQQETAPTHHSGHGGPIRVGHIFRRLFGVYLHVVLRFVPVAAFFTLLPLHGTLRGLTRVEAGRVLALFILAGTIGALAGGYLADRLPRRPLMFLTEAGAGVVLLLAATASGLAFYVALTVGSLLIYAAMPLQILMAQERVPRTESVGSGVVMGFAYGTATLLLVPLGWLGDYYARVADSTLVGVGRELQMAGAFLFPAAVVGLFLRSHPPKAEEHLDKAPPNAAERIVQ